MNIRPYAQGDFPALEKIHDPARMQELRGARLEEAFLPLSVAAEREGLFDYRVYVAESGGEAVGFVAFTPEELAWLYVRPDCQKMGVGTALAEFALCRMGTGALSVEVLRGNEPARRLYRRLGFVQERLESGKMPGNEAFRVQAWVMTRPGGKGTLSFREGKP